MLAIRPRGDISNLPLELIDRIIYQNDYDFQSIRNISRVSKAWRAVSLRYLFSTADFCSKSDFVRWNTLAEYMPHVLQYVKHVVYAPGRRKARHAMKALDARFPKDDNGRRSESEEFRLEGRRIMNTIRAERDVVFTDIPAIPTMPYVHSFQFSCTFPSVEPRNVPFTPATELFLRSFPTAIDVSIACATLAIDDARMILDIFAEARDLTWTAELTLPPAGDDHVPFSGQMYNLQVLRLIDTNSMNWLGGALSHSPLRKIELYNTTPMEGFIRVLEGVSDTLQELVLSSDLVDSVYIPPGLNLPGLRDVSISNILNVAGTKPAEMDAIASMLMSLSSASCPLLTRIGLELWVDETPVIDLFRNWKALGQAMSHRFPSLSTVHVLLMLDDVPTSEMKEAIEKSVKDVMPDVAIKMSFGWENEHL